MTKLQLLRTSRATISVPRALLVAFIAATISNCASADSPAREKISQYEIVATHPHDASAFTQGLAILDGKLLESRGQFGRSAVTISTIKTAAVRRRRDVEAKYFAEGLAVAGDRIVQLTWQSGIAFVYDTALERRGEFRYNGQGWGLAHDGRNWLMSDGSNRIAVRRSEDFSLDHEVRVMDGGKPVWQLNELEYAEGKLYANVWHTDRIAEIDPATGVVESWFDFSALRQAFPKPADWDENEHVLNGIAFDPSTRHFYLTGKCWPVVFEVRLKSSSAAAP
jgi:glutaminyl-peptide cyclotransferase